MVHVSGFLSASEMIDAMKSSGGKSTWASKRVRFEHGDGLFPDLLPRVKELGIIVVQNPSHFAHNMKLARAQPLKSFLVAGIPLALGSDGGGRINPYVDIMFASTHPDRPSEAITREQAVIAYTLTSAYAEFAEKDKGSLEPAKLADSRGSVARHFQCAHGRTVKNAICVDLGGGANCLRRWYLALSICK